VAQKAISGFFKFVLSYVSTAQIIVGSFEKGKSSMAQGSPPILAHI
jgi:hypothetical protein